MTRTRWTVVLVAVTAVACTQEVAVVGERGDIAVTAAFATASAAPDLSALYFTLLNRGSVADTLAHIASVAPAVLHTVVTNDGLSTMAPVAALPIPADSCVAMRPGGYHVMFMDLQKPLTKGAEFKGTLVFEKAGPLAVQYKVEALGAKPPGAAGGHDQMKMKH